MRALFSRFLAFLLSLLLPVMSLVYGVPKAGSAYAAEDADSVLMTAAIVSDLHINNSITHIRNVRIMRLFSGIAKSEKPLDTLVIPGDLTERATATEYAVLAKLLHDYAPAKAVIPATGNHDIRGTMTVEDYPDNIRNYYAFCDALGIRTDKPYWSTAVNGYRFIVLGSEAEVKDCAFISDEQIAWLDDMLTQEQNGGKPVFVICHQTLAHTNNVDESWPVAGTLGDQAEAVEAVLRKHTDAGLTVIYCSGHLHDDFSVHSFEMPGSNLYCLNLPSAQYNGDGGKGVVLEAYADRILLRTRNFVTGEWLPDVYTVPVVHAG